MKAPKTCITMLMLSMLVCSCSKKDEIVTKSEPALQTLSASTAEKLETVSGLGVFNGGTDVVTEKLDYAGIKLARTPVILSTKTHSDVVDKYLEDGYSVQINLNWKQPVFGPVAYPTDLDLVKSRAEEFFSYYSTWKEQIPIVVVENEWENTHYHSGEIDHYLDELRVITEIGHKYGFKIADAGLSGTSFRRWVYTKLDGDMAKLWAQWYWIGINNGNFVKLIEAVNYYAQAIQTIPIDYLNVHWYNLDTCRYGFETAANIYKTACNKQSLICNEFGVKLDSDELFHNTVDEINGSVYFAIAYSGNGKGNGKTAVTLTNSMLDALKPAFYGK